MQSRRVFLGGTAAAALSSALAAPSRAAKDDLSLAAWSLVRSFRNQRWKNLDLPRIVREDLKLNGLEFVNTFFENPTMHYLQQLKKNGDANGVTFVRIMVDDEGNTAAPGKQERMQAAVAHRKWIDIAHYLGCSDIRCNMRGGLPNWKEDKDIVNRAAESFRDILGYARGSGLNVIIENHGGASSDPDILLSLMKTVNDPRFGILPDFGNINRGDDNAEVIRRLMPYAKGVSVKAGWAEDGTNPGWDLEKIIKICQDAGYRGWWGIESSYGQRRARGERSPEPRLSPDQAWQNEVKGVMLTKAVLERTVMRKG